MKILRKFQKAIRISQHYFAQNSFKKKTEIYSNPLLKILVQSIEQVRNNDFKEEDRRIFSNIQKYREQLSKSEEIIDYSMFQEGQSGLVKTAFHRATSPEIWCKLHYTLTKNFQAQNYLEIGTNLGVSGSYILSGLKNQKDYQFISMEGVPKLVEISSKQFNTISDPNHFKIIEGLYEQTFSQMLEMPIQFDMAFIDGNHRYEPTLYYFQEIKKKLKNPALVIFDDIYTSNEMMRVWKKIQKDSDINYLVDLYKLGIVILDQNDSVKRKYFKGFLTR
jgi:predicted O-methyltransferase YrrM